MPARLRPMTGATRRHRLAGGADRAGARSRQERLAYKMLLPVFGTVVVIATIPFVLAVSQSLTSDAAHSSGSTTTSGRSATRRSSSRSSRPPSTPRSSCRCELLVGLGLALLVHRTIRSPGSARRSTSRRSIPIVIPQIAVGVVFRLIYAPDYGILNVLLGNTGHDQTLWLSCPPLAMFSVASVDIWQWTPFVYLVIFAGLQTVPGVGRGRTGRWGRAWDQFRHIELPYLRPLVLLVLFFRIADVLRVFDAVYILTGGGPGYDHAVPEPVSLPHRFRFTDLSQASALAVVFMVAMIVFYRSSAGSCRRTAPDAPTPSLAPRGHRWSWCSSGSCSCSRSSTSWRRRSRRRPSSLPRCRPCCRSSPRWMPITACCRTGLLRAPRQQRHRRASQRPSSPS